MISQGMARSKFLAKFAQTCTAVPKHLNVFQSCVSHVMIDPPNNTCNIHYLRKSPVFCRINAHCISGGMQIFV
jgi:hypothetical protein